MNKIPTIFKRNPENMKYVLPEPNEECLWVFSGEGVATRKFDGTCCLIERGVIYKRREIKPGKPQPEDFRRCETDKNTGKTVGWVPCKKDDKSDKWHFEAFEKREFWDDGTYELCGPKVQGNPEGFSDHVLIKHECAEVFSGIPRDWDLLKIWLKAQPYEGIVFHHPDGRMAKIKKRDFE